ncbi:MAG: hypothetical protein COV59_00720 [Candidatus Magasanikbacteria bacterium CG11_big_fil_rev_8_21_14_0_20_39_34]|uniref:Glycosyltransferase RgtA/B/C/D-like domain-containing protein n=1 Tax=Candidatus Magasanikbacteria bacterium CG11_big_fil_rev_8_21_14_0_20_39_34 TaxID=1974653 RepID=A0A2H0N8L3_9BACT|nr:MAG: hypothetical protein COV59_00720 [Candidatus Magasanikbacteria bacterium CG11_big_fil_rev_8_21_14_0_20_39_34]
MKKKFLYLFTHFQFQFFAILLIAILFRICFLSSGVLLGDEPLYSVRSIGFVDSFASDLQTTPFDWFPNGLPWWGTLSFHDHPPLFFIIQNLFFRNLGYSIFLSRLPAALFGIGSVIVSFFIGKQLYNKKLGIFCMGLMAINDFSVVYTRVSMLESVTLFFILLSFYFFLRSLKEKKFLYPWGIALGFSFLSKYVSFAIFPVYILGFFVYKREYLKSIRLYTAIFLSLIIFSPVIIYNIGMYRATGHFDLQFAFLLKQDISEHWKKLPGKTQRGDLLQRISDMGTLLYLYTPVFFLFALSAFFYPIAKLFQRKKWDTATFCTFLSTVCFLVFFLLIGARTRFLFYLTPFFIFLMVPFLRDFFDISKKWTKAFLWIWIAYEMFFSVNAVVASTGRKIGKASVTYPKQLYLPDYGANALETYLRKELDDLKPNPHSRFKNQNYQSAVDRFYQLNMGQETPVFLFFDSRAGVGTLVQSYVRRTMYLGLPLAGIESFPQYIFTINASNAHHLVYYIYSTPASSQNTNVNRPGMSPDVFKNKLDLLGIKPHNIYTHDGDIAYQIYKIDWSIALYAYKNVGGMSLPTDIRE